MKDKYGFSSVDVIGICLAFPRVLYGDMCGLLDDRKSFLLTMTWQVVWRAMWMVCLRFVGKFGSFMTWL